MSKYKIVEMEIVGVKEKGLPLATPQKNNNNNTI